MKKIWSLRLERDESLHAVFSNGNLFLSSRNVLFCFNSRGLRWKRRIRATFYRDPYFDVSISALDATEGYIVVGTNFMDGKVYLLNDQGRLLWEHQFATIASLGWRPEDVTTVKINYPYIAVGTEFTNEYLYVYTTTRKRVFDRKVKGRVECISFIGDSLVVGTDSHLHSFNLVGNEKYTVDTPARKVEALDDIIFVVNNSGIVAFKLLSKLKIKNYWSVKSDSKNSDFCLTENFVIFATKNSLQYISRDGDTLWRKEFDESIYSLFFDKSTNRIYVGMNGRINVLSITGELVKRIDVDGKVIKIGRLDDIVALVWKEGIALYRLLNFQK